jgi:hypothetical protein
LRAHVEMTEARNTLTRSNYQEWSPDQRQGMMPVSVREATQDYPDPWRMAKVGQVHPAQPAETKAGA